MTDIQTQVGERIRVLRQRGDVTQVELARKSGLHRSHLSEIECGQCNVCLQTLEAICRTLNVSIEKVFKGIGVPGPKRKRPRMPARTGGRR